MKLRILNVEDSERDAALLRRHLTRAGYELVFERAETPAAMRAALLASEWDIILADYSMPGFGAVLALALLKETGLDIPFIVISGTIGEELAVEVMRAGASDYLMKGKLTRLGAAVEREIEEAGNRRRRRLAEAELTRLHLEVQQQRDRLNTIVRSVPGVVWEAWGQPDTSTQRIDFVSDYVTTMLGYSVEEWLSTPNFWLTIVHPEDRERIARESSDSFLSGKNATFEFRWVTKGGTAIWVQSHSVVVFDEAGRPAGMRGVNIDVTEQRLAEARLHETEERFRRYFELGLVGMAITTPAKGIVEVNDRICAILGYDRQELLKKTWAELTHPEDLPADADLFKRVLVGEIEGYSVDKRFVHKSGRIVDTTIAVRCVRQADGSISYFAAMMEDITARNRAEQALRDSEERYRQLFESNPDATFVFERDTLQFLAYNKAAIQEYGYSQDELVSLTARNIWVPSEVPAFLKRLDEMEFGPPPGTTWKHQRKDGTIIDVEITRRPLLFSGKPAWIMIAHNVTQRMALEEQFRQAQKMEAIGQLAGGMAHDFNNLLTVINGYSEMAAGRLPPEDPLRNDLEQIRQAGTRAAGLTRQLLAFSRKQVLLLTVLDVNRTISELERMLQRLIGEDIELTTNLAKDAGRIKADRGQIEQIVMNLVVNARDAMPAGGTLVIETQSVDLTADYRHQHAEVSPGPYVMIAVIDSGTGIDAPTQARMFEPFFTTKESGKGTGLGLSTVYGIVQQSGGTIAVQSEVGAGTTFTIFLPRVGNDAQLYEEILKQKEGARGAETILLTEDDDMVRAFASRVLSTYGYRVLEASTPAAALLLCEQTTEPIHLLVTDMVMPGMNGRDLAGRLQLIRPKLRVVYMSGYADKAIVRDQVLDEKTPFIQKPFTPRSLVDKIREVLDEPPERI